MSRNPTFDIMKGITIILVIMGHESWTPELVRKAIFAFHMPLFFIVAGYFYKPHAIIRDIRRLVVPYLFTGGLLVVYHILSNLPSFDVFVLKRDLLNIFWGSGWHMFSVFIVCSFCEMRACRKFLCFGGASFIADIMLSFIPVEYWFLKTGE